MLTLTESSLYVGGKLLIEDASLTIGPGKRIGVVGRNGSGKSHLMQLLAGEVSPDSGSRKVAKDTQVLLVKQELPDDNQSPLEYLRDNDPELLALESQIAEADNDELGDLLNSQVELEEERYEKLAPKVLMGLGLSKEELERPMRNLSGGLRMRINLAQALVRTPDVLLLDEPTNHLDLESTQWFIAFLKNYSPTASFVIVTHDVKLLMEVCNTTVHLRNGTLRQFEGDYALYREKLKSEDEKQEQANKDIQKQIERKMDIYYKFRDLPENRAAQAVSQKKRADALEEKLVPVIKEEPVITLNFKEPALLSNPIVNLREVSIGYGNRTILNKLNLSIPYGAKIGLIGKNGEGKSTLVKCLVDKLNPTQGTVDRHLHLKIGYFSQDLTDELDANLSVYQQFIKKTGISKDADVRSNLAEYGFGYDKVSTLVGDLSGGEKSRLTFSFICINAPNLIILDEPTNHLDVETRDELVRSLKHFKGSVILVSHDWDLHEKTMDQFWLAQKGSVTVYQQGLAHYHKQLQSFIGTNLQSDKIESGKKAKPEKAKQVFFKPTPAKNNTTTTTTTPAPKPAGRGNNRPARGK